MNVTVRTPELAAAMGPLQRLIESADQQTANEKQGRLLIGATDKVCKVIKTDLDRRMSSAKLSEVEAKQIEGHATTAAPAIEKSIEPTNGNGIAHVCPECGSTRNAA